MPNVSTKALFNRETLKEQARLHLDLQIAELEAEVARLQDPQSMIPEIAEWRATQEARVTELYENLPSIDDDSLARFSIEPKPRRDSSARRAAQQRLYEYREKRSRVDAKAASLVTDEDGNISLTKTQLHEYFGL